MRRIARRGDEIERLLGKMGCNLLQNPSIFFSNDKTRSKRNQTLDGEETVDRSDLEAEVRKI